MKIEIDIDEKYLDTEVLIRAAKLDADIENFRGTVKELPNREMIDVPVDEVQIVELYSK